MIKKISRKRCLKLYPKLPWSVPRREQYVFPATQGQYILTLQSATARSHSKDIAAALQKLAQGMKYEKLVFMGETTTPWLYQKDDYKPVAAAQQFLQTLKVSDTFNGGLLVDNDDLPTFVQHLFWMVRGNASLPIVYAMDEGQHIVANLCQYGNIHLFTLDKETDKLFNKVLGASGLSFLGAPGCNETFGKRNKIEGRGLIV